eukprot:11175941-Lingulodinium_polyedra.AAC.1
MGVQRARLGISVEVWSGWSSGSGSRPLALAPIPNCRHASPCSGRGSVRSTMPKGLSGALCSRLQAA